VKTNKEGKKRERIKGYSSRKYQTNRKRKNTKTWKYNKEEFKQDI